MTRSYDNWQRLVEATLKREELRRVAREDSMSSSTYSDFSGSFHLNELCLNFEIMGISFSYEQIIQATRDFSDENLIKHGQYGDIFWGTLEESFSVKNSNGIGDLTRVVVKRFIVWDACLLELDFFSKISDRRFVPLLGHCLDEEDEKFLVYRYMSNADLSCSLFKKPDKRNDGLPSLDWITRSKIAIGVAEGLVFLHDECAPPLVHGDVQASSILLDVNFEVRLGSLSQVGAQRRGIPTGTGNKTCTDDVYCFGKVLLELVTGKLGISASSDANLDWLQSTLLQINIDDKGPIISIVDPSLIIEKDMLEELVWAVAIVSKACLNPNPSRRPIIRYVLKALENPLKVIEVVKDQKKCWIPGWEFALLTAKSAASMRKRVPGTSFIWFKKSLKCIVSN